jgi:hypothetical protein
MPARSKDLAGFVFYGDLGNGLTRLLWEQDTLGSNPRSPTRFFEIKTLNPSFSHSFYATAAKFTGGKTACVTGTVCEMRVRCGRPINNRPQVNNLPHIECHDRSHVR